MTLLFDLVALLVFPGLAFTVVAGVVSIWAVHWLSTLSARQAPTPWSELTADSRRLLDLAVHPDAAELNATSAVLLLTIISTAAAATSLWGSFSFSSRWVWGNLGVLLALLVATPALGFLWRTWQAHSDDSDRRRVVLLAVYLGLFLLTLVTPFIAGQSVSLGEVIRSANRTWPVALSAGGALSFLASTAAATALLVLLDSLLDDCLLLTGGAVQVFLVQVSRATYWFVVASALAVLFWSPPGNQAVALLASVLAYVVILAALAGLRGALHRVESGRLLYTGWLPAGVLAVLALPLAAWGL